MSSFPTVQLEGPRLMKQPSATQVYQEERTILPEPNIQISQGFDWGSVAREAANLGIGIVQGIREDEWSLRASAMQKDQDDTERAIKAAVRVNDFGVVDSIKSEYKKRSATMLGGDPDDDAFTGTSMAQRKLLNQVRGFDANIDAYLDEQRIGWQESIEFDNYTTFKMNMQKRLLEDPAYIGTAIQELNTLYKDNGGSEDMSQPLPAKGLSANKRKMLFEIQKDVLDLMEEREKMSAAPKTLADMLKERRQTLALVSDTLERAEGYVKKADEILERPNLTDEEKAEAIRLRSEALREQRFAMSQYQQTVGGLVDTVINNIYEGMPEDFVGPPEIPQEFDEPFSLESMTTLLQIGGFEPEDASALRNAFDKVEKLQSAGSDFSIDRKMRDQARERLVSEAESMVGLAKANVAQIDQALREADLTGDTRTATLLRFRRDTIIKKLHDSLYFKTVHPFIPESYKASRRLEDFIGRSIGMDRNPFMAFVGTDGNILLPFDQDGSYPMAQFLSRNDFGIAGDVYKEVQKKYNAFIATSSDVPLGSRKSAGGLTQDEQDTLDAYLFAQGQQPNQRVSDDKQQRYALILLGDMVGVDELGNFPSLSDILDGTAKVNSKIPFNRALFMQTPLVDQMIDMIRTSQSEEERDRIFDQVEKLFKADEVGNLGYETPEHTKRKFLTLFENPVDPKTTEMAFLFAHEDTRAYILDSLKPGPEMSAGFIARLRGMHERYKKDGQRSSPRLFIDTVGQETRYNATTQVFVNNVMQGLSSIGNRPVGDRENEDLLVASRNRELINEELIPAIIENLGDEFGLKPEDMTNIANAQFFKEQFLRTIVENAHTYIDPQTQRIKMNGSDINSVAGAVAKEIRAYGYTYDSQYGTFTRENIDRSPAKETTLSSLLFEKNARFDPGREQRLSMFLGMQPKPPSFVEYATDFVGPPRDDDKATDIEIAAYTSKKLTQQQKDVFKRLANENPFESLVMLGMYRPQSSVISDNDMLTSITKAVDGMPKDNLTILSMTAASKLIGLDVLSEDYADTLRNLSVDIRRSIETKDGRYRLSVVDSRNNYDDAGMHETIRVVAGDSNKVLSSIQPRKHNFNTLSGELTQYSEADLTKIVSSEDANELLKEQAAREYFRKTDDRYILGSVKKKPWELRGGEALVDLPTEETRTIFYTETNKKTGMVEMYSAEVFTGGWFVTNPSLVERGSHGFREVSGTRSFLGAIKQSYSGFGVSTEPAVRQRSLMNLIDDPNISESDRNKTVAQFFNSNPDRTSLVTNERWTVSGTRRDKYYVRDVDGVPYIFKGEESHRGFNMWEFVSSPKKIGPLKKQNTLDLQRPINEMWAETEEGKEAVSEFTQKFDWSFSQPRGRSGTTITGKPYWLPNDMRNTALEPGNLSIGSAVLIPDAPVGENNPVNVEIRRYKGKFYVVRKDSRDTSQHFGVLNNIEDANKYVESMKRFLNQ